MSADDPKPEDAPETLQDEQAEGGPPQEELDEKAPTTEGADEASAEQAGEPEAEAEPKPKRKPAAKKPAAEKAAADEADAEDAEEADEAPKPKRSRAKKADEPKAEAPKQAARPRRGAASSNGDARVVRAQARYVRTSARKARLVCEHLRGKSVEEARAILQHTPRAVARDWSKLLESAVANAEHNHELVGDELRILSITADEGPTIKRFRPRAMGRATRIRKRTSHLSIALTAKES